MGGREPAEVEQALHELARKELVRPVRAARCRAGGSTASGTLLVSDVCYQQIPRSGPRRQAPRPRRRGSSGRPANAPTISPTSSRTITGRALEFHRAAGRRPDDLVELRDRTIHSLTLAGERALPLDVRRAQTSFAAALDLAGSEHPARAELLESRGNTALQRGLLRDADAALDDALALHLPARGDTPAAARTLRQSSVVAQRRGETDVAESKALQALELVQALPAGAGARGGA